MGFGEGRGEYGGFGENEEEMNRSRYGFATEEGNVFNVVEEEKEETDFNVEITNEDIELIRSQAEEYRKYEETGEMEGSHSVELEAVLGRLRKEAPELGIEEKELTPDEVTKYNEKKDIDIKKAVEEKTKEGADKQWDKEKLEKEIESEEIKIEIAMASYLKDIYGDKRLKEKGLEVSDARWDRMMKGLEYSIEKKDWDEVITRAGQMNNIDPEKFKELQESGRNPFHAEIKKMLLLEIESVRKKKDVDVGRLVKDIDLVAKTFSDLRNNIEISGNDRELMLEYLDHVRKQDWAAKDLTSLKKGEYWKVAQTEASMKAIEKMIKSHQIKVY